MPTNYTSYTSHNSRSRNFSRNNNNYSNSYKSTYNNSYANSYNNSSNAYAPNLDSYNDNLPPKENIYDPKSYKEPRRRLLKPKRKRVQYHLVNDGIKLFTKESLIMISTIFIGSMVMLFGNSINTEKKSTISALRNNISTLTKNNETLRAEIDENYDLKEIEYIATTQLGMSKPKSHQIIYVNATTNSYVKQYEEVKPQADTNSIFSNFKTAIANIFSNNIEE